MANTNIEAFDDYDQMMSQSESNGWELKLQYAKEFYALREQMALRSNLKELENEISRHRQGTEARMAAEKAYAAKVAQINQEAASRTAAYRAQRYKAASLEEKQQILQDTMQTLQAKMSAIDSELLYRSQRGGELSELEKQQIAQLKAAKLRAEEEYRTVQQQNLQILKSENYKQINAVRENLMNLKYDFTGSIGDLLRSMAQVDVKSLNAGIKKSVAEHKKQLAELEAEYERKKAAGEDTTEIENDIQNMKKDTFKEELAQVVTDAIVQTKSDYDKAFTEAENMLNSYKSHVDARLQGSDKNYDDIMNLISSNVSTSPYVKTQSVIENMKKAVDQGISYNVEQRSFLNTIADKIANTFDAFDSNLTRLIRLQQADTTAARLGMEASLTKFFNNMFQDSSYLSGLSDQVATAILDASSQLSKEASTEFEYIVQKWLGSLASVGMSDSAITNIATGINYLSTGDVTSLSNNNQLQTLFAMSASKAGLNYADLLLNGMNASNTNMLLESMVSYLKEIAENSDSQVVRSAYGDIFNMSLSDMKAISNLTTSDISNISGNVLSYSQMNAELQNQFNEVSNRTALSEKLSNLYSNALFGVAEDMASNPATWAMTKMLDYMQKQNIDMAIPFMNIGGFGVDLNTSVQDIMKLGVGLGQAFSLIGNIVQGLGSHGGMDLDNWNATETTTRGSGMSFTTASALGATSGSTYVTNNSSEDMKYSALSTATDDAESSASITNKNHTPEHSFDEFYDTTVDESAGSVNSQDVKLKENNEENAIYAKDARMNFLDTALITHDSLLNEQMNLLFGNMALTEKGILNVYDSNLSWLLTNTIIDSTTLRVQDVNLLMVADKLIANLSTIRVRPEGTSLPVHIASAAETAKLMSSSVSISPGSKIEIDKATLVKAFKEAMGYGEREQAQSIGDLIEGLKNGSIVVKIGNEPGRRIQVDTEASGTSGYTSTINW